MLRRIDVASLLRRLKRRTSGQTFLLVSIALVVLLGVAALAVDIGDLWTTRRLMQSAADAGAVAGADEIAIGGNSTAITAAAKDAARRLPCPNAVRQVAFHGFANRHAGVPRAQQGQFIGIGEIDGSRFGRRRRISSSCA